MYLLGLYCSKCQRATNGTNTLCKEDAKAFDEKYDVKTSVIRNSRGSFLAKIEAEKLNPEGMFVLDE